MGVDVHAERHGQPASPGQEIRRKVQGYAVEVVSEERSEAQVDPDPATAQLHVYADAPPARMDDPLWRSERFMGDGGSLEREAP